MTPLSRELLAEIRRIEIFTRRLVNQQMAGHYQSVFKGRGMSFDEVRLYSKAFGSEDVQHLYRGDPGLADYKQPREETKKVRQATAIGPACLQFFLRCDVFPGLS